MSTVEIRNVAIDLREASIRLGISRQTAYNWARAGRFPVRVFKVGERLRVSSVDLDRFIEGER